MKVFLAWVIWVSGMIVASCVMDSRTETEPAARAKAPPDTCVAPLCYPDIRPDAP